MVPAAGGTRPPARPPRHPLRLCPGAPCGRPGWPQRGIRVPAGPAPGRRPPRRPGGPGARAPPVARGPLARAGRGADRQPGGLRRRPGRGERRSGRARRGGTEAAMVWAATCGLPLEAGVGGAVNRGCAPATTPFWPGYFTATARRQAQLAVARAVEEGRLGPAHRPPLPGVRRALPGHPGGVPPRLILVPKSSCRRHEERELGVAGSSARRAGEPLRYPHEVEGHRRSARARGGSGPAPRSASAVGRGGGPARGCPPPRRAGRTRARTRGCPPAAAARGGPRAAAGGGR